MQALEELIQSECVTVVLFHAEWFQPSRTVKVMVEGLCNEFELTYRYIDVDVEQELTEKFKIDVVPTAFIFQSGEVLWKQKRWVDEAKFRAVISTVSE